MLIRIWKCFRTDWSLGCLGFRGNTEFPGAGLVLCCHSEDVSKALQQTFNIHLSVSDDVPEDQDKRKRSGNRQKMFG